MNVMIMCQGEQRRLRDLGHPKHLVRLGGEFGGEPILERTLRLLAHLLPCHAYTAHVIGPAELEAVTPYGAVEFHRLAAPGTCIVAGLEASRPIWRSDEPALILLGDVVWSEAALGRVVASTDAPLLFWGTSALTAATGEVFAMLVTQPRGCPQGVDELLATCPCRRWGYREAQGGHLRRLYWHATERQRSRPLPFWGREPTYRVIDDWTTDIDTPDDLARLADLAREAELEERRLHPAA